MSSTDAPPATAHPAPEAARCPPRHPSRRLRWPAEPRGPLVFALTSVAVLALVLAHNSFVFTRRFYEGGDGGANSILTLHAKHFGQLLGNYSRIGFAHPGPAFIYVQAFGEWLFHDLLGVVPTPWNGQTIALFGLNAALVGVALALLADWFRSWLATAFAGAVLLAYLAAYGYVVASTWMPWLYVPPFLLLLTAAASVAAGRVRDLWALALAGGLLVHGHAEFLFFAPAIAGVALVVLALRRLLGGTGPVLSGHRRAWLLALGVVAVFALPIALNLALHWPGEIGKYVAYSRSNEAGGHRLREAVEYALQYWPGGTSGRRRSVTAGLFAAAALLAWRNPPGPARVFLRTAVGFVALGAVLFTAYAANGIDHLYEEYIGHFAHALPVLLAMLVAAGLAGLARPASRSPAVRRAAAVVAAGAVAVGLVGGTTSATMYTPQHDNVADLPPMFDLLTRRAGGRPVVLELPRSDPWPEMVALLLAGKRAGHRVCMNDPWWGFIVTPELICTPEEYQTGERVELSMPDKVPSGVRVYGRLGRAVVSTPPVVSAPR